MPFKPSNKPFIVPVFIPHAGCPHRCLFCDQTRTTGQTATLPSEAEIKATISQFLSYAKDTGRWTEISFYGGNFLGLPSAQILKLLDIADGCIREGRAHGIRFSTRPDTIDPERMAMINGFPISTIELGAQSMNNSILDQSQRGHSAEDTTRAMAILKKERWRIGLQMMVGLPGDTSQTAVESGQRIAELQPDFVRIYPCLVLEGSPLAHLFAQGRYSPLSLEQAVDQVKGLYTLFRKADIPVIRMGLQPTTDLNSQSGITTGPFHPAFGELVHSAIWLEALQKCLADLDLSSGQLEIRVHPRQISRLHGHQRQNITRLKAQFHLKTIQTHTDPKLDKDTATINGHGLSLF